MLTSQGGWAVPGPQVVSKSGGGTDRDHSAVRVDAELGVTSRVISGPRRLGDGTL
jgi:hypothetical protein